MALTKVSGGILDPGIDVAGIVTATGFDGPFVGGSGKNVTAGTVTATNLDLNGNGDISGNLVVGGNLTANGDFTTLNTTLREVELLRVESNSSAVAGIITQSGSGDILKLYDSSTPVFVVKDGGKVGIGTDNPHVELDIEGESARIHLHDRDGNQAQILQSGNALYLNLDSEGNGNGSFRIRSGGTTGDSEIIRIKADGAVGIGSTVPTEKLDVIGNIKSIGNVSLSGDLDVDGRTELDTTNISETLNVTGISTLTGQVGFGTHITLPDNARLKIGTHEDIQIYNKGNLSVIANQASSVSENNSLHIHSFNDVLYTTAYSQYFKVGNTLGGGNFSGGDDALTLIKDGAVNVYYDGVKRFSTSGIGATVFGQLDTTDLNVTGVSTFSDTVEVGTGVTALTDGNVSIGGTLELFNTTGDALNNPSEIKISSLTISQHQNTGTYKFQNSNATGSVLLSAGGSGYGGIQFWNGNFSRQYLTTRDQGSVNLYYNNTVRFATSGVGVTVTGEIATSQDYPNFRPTLDFNFAAERKLDPRITYSRTGSASFVNEFGKVVLVGDNVPRFDYGHEYVNANSYKLTNSESRGLLIEEERTNLVSYSIYDGDKSGAAQTSSGDTGNWTLTLGHATLTGGIDAPDGSNDAVRFTALNTGFALLRISVPQFSANGSDSYTLSFYARAISGTGNINCDVQDDNPNLSNWTNQMVTNEWVRIVVTGIPPAENKDFVDLVSNSNTNRVIDFWGVQLEKGAFATSFIPTHGSTVTRGADLAVIDGEDFTEFFNQTEGTINCAYWLGNDNSGMRVFQINDSDNSVIDIVAGAGGGAGGYGYVNTGGVAQANGGQSSVNANNLNTLHVTTLAYKENDVAGINIKTGVLTNDTAATLDGAYNRVTFYQHVNSGDQLNGHLQRVQYYPKRLPDNQLKNLNNQ